MEHFYDIRKKYVDHGQGHVFHFWDELDEQERMCLLEQLNRFDPSEINEAFLKANNSFTDQDYGNITPLPEEAFIDKTSHNMSALKSYQHFGMNAIKHGEVGVIVLAGGQGTRLGSTMPKGCIDFGLPSGKTLFQLQAERISRLEFMACGKIHWYIMVSSSTFKDTVSFFQSKNYFDLDPDHVHFFEQDDSVCLTNDGKIMLRTKSSIATNPNGNGGMYAALSKHNIIDHMKSVGILYVHVYCVDNSLVKVGDPIFIGACIAQRSQLGIKTVSRTDPAESVGLVCLRNNKIDMIEYTQVSNDMACQRTSNGSFTYDHANIANHFYTVAFLDTLCSGLRLKYNAVKKKIPCINMETGKACHVTTPNGIKLEQYIVEPFPLATKFTIYRVDRKQEFSPIKNKDGPFSKKTAMWDLLNLHQHYLNNAGIFNTGDVEISPRISYAGEGLFKYNGELLVGPMTLGK